jgi:MFS family permease
MSNQASAIDQEPRPEKRLKGLFTPRITFVLAVAILSSASLYMVQPFLVVYFHEAVGFSTDAAGLLAALPFLAAFLFGIPGGYVADRLGPVRVFSMAMVVYAISIGLVAFTHTFLWAVILMLASGLAIPVTTSSLSAILNYSAKPEHRGTLQNYLYWSGNLGVVLGLLVSSQFLAAGHSNRPLIWMAAIRLGLGVLAFGVLAGAFAGKSQAEESPPEKPRPSMAAAFKLAFTDKALLFVASTFLLMAVAEAQWSATVPLYFAGHFLRGTTLYGPLLAVQAVIVVLCQPLAVKLFAKRKPAPIFAMGIILLGVGLAFGGFLGTLWAWIIGTVLYAVGEVIASTKFNNLLGELPTPGHSALYFATISSGQYLAFLLGIALGVVVYRTFSPPALFGSMIGIALIAAYLFYRATISQKSRTAQE